MLISDCAWCGHGVHRNERRMFTAIGTNPSGEVYLLEDWFHGSKLYHYKCAYIALRKIRREVKRLAKEQ